MNMLMYFVRCSLLCVITLSHVNAQIDRPFYNDFGTFGNFYYNHKQHQQTPAEGCRLIRNFRDTSTERKCKVIKCHGQKVVLCQKGRTELDTTTYANKGVIRINVAPSRISDEMEQGKREYEEAELEPGFIGTAKILLRLLEKDPFEGTFQYLDHISLWFLNVLMEKTVEYMYDRILHYEDIWFIEHGGRPTKPPATPPGMMPTMAPVPPSLLSPDSDVEATTPQGNSPVGDPGVKPKPSPTTARPDGGSIVSERKTDKSIMKLVTWILPLLSNSLT